MTGTPEAGPGRPGVGRYRRHTAGARRRQVRLRYTEQEYAAVRDAAHAAGLTTTGYVAEAALAAATATDPPRSQPWRQVLLELIDARNQVRRIGVNINQAARALNTTGDMPIWLPQALITCNRSMTRMDDAADAVAALARRGRTTTSRPR